MEYFLGFALRYDQGNLGVKKVSAPLKKSLEMPHDMFSAKKNMSPTFRISAILKVIAYICIYVYLLQTV